MPSTSIRKFDYDPNTRVLSVWFVASGKKFEFLDVPAEAFAAFKAAFAKGVYFNSHIRNRYAFRLAREGSGPDGRLTESQNHLDPGEPRPDQSTRSGQGISRR
ncbi:KTSC domain-containing protein [Mesorhizobium sp. L2C066B000]|uniref:KTSC domain-containing protein n=1 Tax=Mesorhizobium sp. L2C066B000 TaxID=1287105 RepID=UPI0003CFB103|nr:KTSC domain-containing protein [Mesorhizobium sp. L2C066B000]ESZ31979.1 hypothetical protein X732_29000 [Mesorhizobium sp. L2C066B000]